MTRLLPEDILRDPAEIEMNRRGLVSRRQVAALDNATNREVWGALWPLGIAGVWGTLPFDVVQPSQMRHLFIWLTVPWAAFLVAAALHMLPRVITRIRLAYAQREMSTATATVRLRVGWLVVHGKQRRLQAPGVGTITAVLRALPVGYCRFCYLPDTGWLLSAEPVERPVMRPAEVLPWVSSRKRRGVKRD